MIGLDKHVLIRKEKILNPIIKICINIREIFFFITPDQFYSMVNILFSIKIY